ncbi:MAG: signal peptidase II [Gammaproteobacteria bacterium]|nr:signal peptidase II [Gammaproteobacteria bacterium]
MNSKLRILAAILPAVLLLDVITKRWALTALGGGRRMEILDGLVPLTLAFNRGAAFGISIGNDPRWFFIPVTILAMGLLAVLFIQSESGDRVKVVSIALILSGALGNLVDRVRWDRGVVDFIGPIDLGFMHWPIFNVADSAITCGAVLLGISFWREERTRAREAAAGPEEPGSAEPEPGLPARSEDASATTETTPGG